MSVNKLMPLCSGASKARDSPLTVRELGRDLSPSRFTFASTSRQAFDSYGKVPFSPHFDGDTHARAKLPGHLLYSCGREAAAGACVRAVSAAQGQMRPSQPRRPQIPLRQLPQGPRAVRARHASSAAAATQVSRAGAAGAYPPLRRPARPEQHRIRASAHTGRREGVSERGR